jgi:hypothetical protein
MQVGVAFDRTIAFQRCFGRDSVQSEGENTTTRAAPDRPHLDPQ